jgi:hypothetical protein
LKKIQTQVSKELWYGGGGHSIFGWGIPHDIRFIKVEGHQRGILIDLARRDELRHTVCLPGDKKTGLSVDQPSPQDLVRLKAQFKAVGSLAIDFRFLDGVFAGTGGRYRSLLGRVCGTRLSESTWEKFLNIEEVFVG